ncbi:MAG TPA: serine/threonine protein kinase [Victivallis vadensis]|nr:serine/threonine protein kinase [Victivallis vadensis]
MKYDVGDRIGSYQLLYLCGEGAYGRVFLARNVLTQHQVALKLLPLSAKVTARELQGLKNYRECRHPNLLQIHHIDQAEGVLYYTMDAADNLAGTGGGYEPDTLAARLAHRKSLPAGEVAKMAAELLEGLDCLHRRNLLHRDIKPDNILWVDGRATLADIGLTTDSRNASLVGTPGFMSGELLSGKRPANREDDLYALGKVIYCALTGCAVCDYPHYPQSVTISEAAPLIRAYTAACRSPSTVKSSQEMKRLLTAPAETAARRRGGAWRWAAGLLLPAAAAVFFLSWKTEKRPAEAWSAAVPVPPAESTVAAASLPEPLPGGALPVTELELLYRNRTSGQVKALLARAERAEEMLDREAVEKLGELNAHEMTAETSRMVRGLILKAREEHWREDPLCRLARKEEQVKAFLAGDGEDVRAFLTLLDERDSLVRTCMKLNDDKR